MSTVGSRPAVLRSMYPTMQFFAACTQQCSSTQHVPNNAVLRIPIYT